METNKFIKSLSALAQETRLAIFRYLVQAGKNGVAVGEIAKQLDLANATLSFHLKELANADLIISRQEGRFIFYTANYEQITHLMHYLLENCCQGKPCESSGSDSSSCC